MFEKINWEVKEDIWCNSFLLFHMKISIGAPCVETGEEEIRFIFLFIHVFALECWKLFKWELFKIIMRGNIPYSGQKTCLHIAPSLCQTVRNLNSDLPNGTVKCHKRVCLSPIKTFQICCIFNRLKIFLNPLQLLCP